MTVYEENNIPIEVDGLEVIQEMHMVAEQLIDKREPCARYEFGNSMMPFLESGQFCKLIPLQKDDVINIGDIVVSFINGSINTHMVWMKKELNGTMYCLIADSLGHPIGWTKDIIGKAEGIPHKIKQSSVYTKKISRGDIASIDMPISASRVSLVENDDILLDDDINAERRLRAFTRNR